MVVVAGQPAGRLLLSTAAVVHVVDLALLGRHRGRGVGTALLTEVQAVAVEVGAPVELSVAAGDDRLRQWYERLGFRVRSGQGAHLRMTWSPPTAADGLARFRSIVLADPALQCRLLAVPDRAGFVDLVVRLAAEAGIDVHPADVDDALSASRRAWYSSPWI
jgi:hypothetical protein